MTQVTFLHQHLPYAYLTPTRRHTNKHQKHIYIYLYIYQRQKMLATPIEIQRFTFNN